MTPPKLEVKPSAPPMPIIREDGLRWLTARWLTKHPHEPFIMEALHLRKAGLVGQDVARWVDENQANLDQYFSIMSVTAGDLWEKMFRDDIHAWKERSKRKDE